MRFFTMPAPMGMLISGQIQTETRRLLPLSSWTVCSIDSISDVEFPRYLLNPNRFLRYPSRKAAQVMIAPPSQKYPSSSRTVSWSPGRNSFFSRIAIYAEFSSVSRRIGCVNGSSMVNTIRHKHRPHRKRTRGMPYDRRKNSFFLKRWTIRMNPILNRTDIRTEKTLMFIPHHRPFHGTP